METDQTSVPGRIALQPKTTVEQRVLGETFARMTNVSQMPEHPDYIGTEDVFYTLDLGEYDELDHGLWADAEVEANEYGRISPDPGSRALVLIHDPEESAGEATEEEIEDAVESLSEGNDGGENEFSQDALEVAEDIEAAEPLEDRDAEIIWELASDASTTGVVDIPVDGQSDEEIVEDLREFVDVVRTRVEDEIETERESDEE